jgi:hypothetical protein
MVKCVPAPRCSILMRYTTIPSLPNHYPPDLNSIQYPKFKAIYNKPPQSRRFREALHSLQMATSRSDTRQKNSRKSQNKIPLIIHTISQLGSDIKAINSSNHCSKTHYHKFSNTLLSPRKGYHLSSPQLLELTQSSRVRLTQLLNHFSSKL